MKFLFIFFFFALISVQSMAITIEIEPEDIVEVSDILQSFITTNQQLASQTSVRLAIIRTLKRATCGVVKLTGVLFTLVGANLLTSKFESKVNLQPIEKIAQISSPPKICTNEFGCTTNMCWRTCDQANNNNNQSDNELRKRAWCFISKNKTSTYHACTYPYECSACWNCSSPCAV